MPRAASSSGGRYAVVSQTTAVSAGELTIAILDAVSPNAASDFDHSPLWQKSYARITLHFVK